jgi:hypothetical protein
MAATDPISEGLVRILSKSYTPADAQRPDHLSNLEHFSLVTVEVDDEAVLSRGK